MGWFEEQLKSRNQKDSEIFEEAVKGLGDAVMGRRFADAHDNASTAIGEILKYYHIHVHLEELPREVKTLEEQFDYRLRPYGIARRRVTLEKGFYKNAIGPMIGTLKEDGSTVALIPGKLSGYSFYDHKTGKHIRLTRKSEKLLETEALAFYLPLPERALTVADLLKYMVGQLTLADVLLYVGSLAGASLLGLLAPMFTRLLFGSVLSGGDVGVLLALAAFMAAYGISRVLYQVYESLVASRVRIKQDLAVQAAVMMRVLSLPPEFFRDYASGELSERAAYIKSLCTMLFDSIGTTGLTAVFSLVYVGQLFRYAPGMVAPAVITSAVTMILSILTTLIGIRVSRERMLLSSKESGMSYSMIAGIQKIKLAGAEKRMFSRWARLYARVASLAYNPPFLLKMHTALQTFVSLTGWFVIYLFACRGGVSVADYYAFNTAYGMVSGAFAAFAGIASTLANLKPTLEMARPLMEAAPELSEGKKILTTLHGAIELNHVSFRYEEGMPNVIDDLSLRIRPGEYVALVGATGCGKSTLLRLLLGFETPQRGAIYYDRQDITHIDLRSLRRMIGTVMQDGKLFLGDIYSNISIASPDLTLDEAWEAAEIASIADDIRAMPMGMHTVISEGQGGISGGQRQRLMIARAVAPKPKILMFDEATSALDNVTQKKVSDAIDGLNCTRIVIAHRLSTIRHADRIIVLENGRIAEEGDYQTLIEKNGTFASLVARQRLDNGEDD